jgi:hypothetical protein
MRHVVNQAVEHSDINSSTLLVGFRARALADLWKQQQQQQEQQQSLQCAVLASKRKTVVLKCFQASLERQGIHVGTSRRLQHLCRTLLRSYKFLQGGGAARNNLTS